MFASCYHLESSLATFDSLPHVRLCRGSTSPLTWTKEVLNTFAWQQLHYNQHNTLKTFKEDKETAKELKEMSVPTFCLM